jgi:hypothetical protein
MIPTASPDLKFPEADAELGMEAIPLSNVDKRAR